jgi:integrase
VAVRCDAEAGPASIDQAISAIRRLHRDAGHPGQPDTTAARRILRAYRRARAEAGRRPRQAPPAVLDTIRALVDAADPASPAGLRDRVLVVLGFAGMLRRSELAALHLDDVAEVDDGLELLVRASKTDQAGTGATVAIPYGQHPATCPVRLLRAWRALLAEHDIHDGPLLRRVDRWGHLGGSMSGGGIRHALQALAARASLPNAEQIRPHSLRAGGATAAYRAGNPVAAIAAHGRWAPGSPVVLTYLRAVDRWRDNPMTGVGL